MMNVWICFLVALVGAFVYAISTNGKAAQLGLVAYGTGLLAGLFVIATRVVHILP